MTRPNIPWISTHDINPHLGAYAGVHPGADYAITPNLDRLAAEGMRFDQAFAAAPICAPSRPDGRAWKILCDATPAPANTELWFKACRLGYSDSREVRLVPAPAE
jgi:hypothetical protein